MRLVKSVLANLSIKQDNNREKGRFLDWNLPIDFELTRSKNEQGERK